MNVNNELLIFIRDDASYQFVFFSFFSLKLNYDLRQAFSK